MTRQVMVPRPYAPAATMFMADRKRSALWAPVGMGKTTLVETLVQALLYSGDLDDPVLVLGPKRVARDVWTDEAAKWTQLKDLIISPIVGDIPKRYRALDTKAHIYTTNYEQLPWLVRHWGRNWPYKLVVADESTRLKGYRLRGGGERAAALARVAWSLTDKWVNLTGTPAPEGLKDLWGQTWFLDRGQRLGIAHGAFMERWFKVNQYSRKVEPFPHSEAQIHAALHDICLTLDPHDYFDIKKPIEENIVVHLPPAARTIYDELEKELFAKLGSGRTIEVFNAAALTNKCLQLANGAVYTGAPEWEAVHDEKLEALESIAYESGGTPLLVAYSFKSDVARIKKAFGKQVAELATKEGMDRFKAGDALYGVGHPASLGHGIDGLQYVTNILVRYGHTWSSELTQQMAGRIGPTRQAQAGFDRHQFIYNLVAKDTLDEIVILSHEQKLTVERALMLAMKRRR